MKKVLIFAMVFLMFAVLMPMRVYANSAEPPSFVIYSPNAPKDAEIFILAEDGEHNASMYDKHIRLWETSFFIDYYGFDKADTKLIVRSEEKSFEVEFPDKYADGSFSSFYTLDFEAETLKVNVSPSRGKIMIWARVLLTLLIECVFYFLLKYRAVRSYIAFIAINLVTQTLVNVIVTSNGGSISFYAGYDFMVYLFMEFFVFIFEMAILMIAVNEKGKWVVLHAFAANALSMVLGGFMLVFLPY
ncbi:MAG: hypothetical protein K2K34_00805 [Oscillospiraceae bacterium]|nr:hypothetical protein [Oscillospiraceae bacterium]